MLGKLRVAWGFCLIVILCACSTGKVLESPAGLEKKPSDGGEVKYVDAKNPTIARAIVPSDKAENSKFIQIQVVDVQNPRGYTATFRVDYQPRTGEKIFLGAFSLYPSDSPGTFIVATHGHVKSDGSIVVSLFVPKNYRAPDVLKAGIGRIQFLAEKNN